MENTGKRRDPNKNPIKHVVCLTIDLIKSTPAGMAIRTYELDRFNSGLIEQIKPHLIGLGLDKTLLKFTGDGWIVFSDDAETIPAQCCLAYIMAHRFQREMSEALDVPPNRIPGLRLAICSGRDMLVSLPNGCIDWVGDSARRSNRAAGLCDMNEVLIDEFIRGHVFRDFETRSKGVVDSDSGEEFPVHTLGEMKPIDITHPTPEVFVYTLDIMGRQKEANALVRNVTGQLELEAALPNAEIEILLHRWNRLIAAAPDYATALSTAGSMVESDIMPNTITYNILINKAEYYEAARGVLAEMDKAKVEPDVVTFNTLMNKAGSFAVARAVLDEMQKAKVEPNVVTFSTLLAKAGAFAEARAVLAEMEKAGVEPNVVTFSTLMDKAGSFAEVRGVLAEMDKAEVEPNVVTFNTLINKAGDFAEARVVLEEMKKAEVRPDEVTFNTLIKKAEDFAEAGGVLEEMKKAEVRPDEVTFNTLMDKADDFAKARAILEEMREAKVEADVVTFNTLIKKADDFAEARSVLEEMDKAKVKPDVVTFSMLFSKDLSAVDADDLIKWYLSLPYHPERGMQIAIRSYHKAGCIADAFRLTLDYAHLPGARRVIREHPEKALSYFAHLYKNYPENPNTPYALGVVYMELGDDDRAKPLLELALRYASAGPRVQQIKSWLAEIETRKCRH